MKKAVSLILVLVMVATLFVGCGSKASADKLSIGFIGPLTGGTAVYGTAAKNGAELAVKEINAKGGVQIELNCEDDESDAEKSVNAYNSLKDWGMQVLVGSVTTTACIPVAAECYKDRIFALTPSASSPDVTKDKDNVYQLCFNDPNQGKASALYISEHYPDAKVAVIYNNADAYSTGIYDTFKAEADTRGINIVSTGTCTNDTTDFSVQVNDAKDKGADIVFLPIYYTPASLILKQADSIGYAPVFFGVDGMDGILTCEGFDPALAEGVMLLTPFAADADDEATKAFVAAYEEAYGETPNQFAADGYDCIYAVYEAFLKTGLGTDVSAAELCDAMIAQFNSMSFSGLTGANMTWVDGMVDKSPAAVVIKDGVYVDAG